MLDRYDNKELIGRFTIIDEKEPESPTTRKLSTVDTMVMRTL